MRDDVGGGAGVLGTGNLPSAERPQGEGCYYSNSTDN